MRDPIRRLPIVLKKVSKSILVVTNTVRVRSQMTGIRALGYECTLVAAGGGAMDFLRAGRRVNVVVLDLQSTESAEKLMIWIRVNRPGVRVICLLTDADLADFGPKAAALGAAVLGESEIAKIPEVLRNLLSQQVR